MRTTTKPGGLTLQQQVQQARNKIAAMHATPVYNLAVEPWLPVTAANGIEKVGLRDLFLRAHELNDLAIPNPLLRAATRRFLIALAADIVNRDRTVPLTYWRSAHADNSGFNTTQVDATLAAHAEHLWMWHPASPFLQDQRLAAYSTRPDVHLPITDMVLHLPSGSTMAWWIKAGEPALDNRLAADATALLLIARWFYAANGNCADVTLPGGNTVGAQAGGAFAEGVATVTHAFRVDRNSLFRTLVRGMPKTLVDQDTIDLGSPVEGCAWLDPDQPQPSRSRLYQATLNPAMVLLTGRDEHGYVTGWLRGSTPIPDGDAKSRREDAKAADQHRIIREFTDGKTAPVRIRPGAVRAEIVRQFHRDAQKLRQLTGVVNDAACFVQPARALAEHETLDLFLVSKGGTGSSPVWEDMVGVDLPAVYVDPGNPHLAEIRAVVAVAYDPLDGAQALLERAIADLLAQASPNGWQRPSPKMSKGLYGSYKALRDKAVNEWAARTAVAFDAALANPNGQEAADWRDLAYQVARDVFDQSAGPYLTSTRYAPRYAAARRSLTHGR